MDTPVQRGEIARMVGAQLCFLFAVGPAIVAAMLVRDWLQADVAVAMGVMTVTSATAVGIGVVLLSRRVRHGFTAAFAVSIALLVGYLLLKLWQSCWDFGLGGR